MVNSYNEENNDSSNELAEIETLAKNIFTEKTFTIDVDLIPDKQCSKLYDDIGIENKVNEEIVK